MSRHKYIVEPEDKDEIIRLYYKGFSMTKIAELTGYTDYNIQLTIKKYTPFFSEYCPRVSPITENNVSNATEAMKVTGSLITHHKRKSEEQLRKEVTDYYNIGCDIDFIISKMQCLTRTEIEQILCDQGVIKKQDNTTNAKKRIDVEDVKSFADSIKPGDKYIVKTSPYDRMYFGKPDTIEVTINKKYKNIVDTDHGSFSYVDLYLSLL